jgi:hypothetical protein
MTIDYFRNAGRQTNIIFKGGGQEKIGIQIIHGGWEDGYWSGERNKEG